MTRHKKVYLAFEQAARSYPDGLCVIAGATALTYKEVEHGVSKLHQSILWHAADEKILGVPTTRGIDQLIMVLAILKAGKAYLPLDFGYPESRLRAMIDTAELTTCLTTSADIEAVKATGLRPLVPNNMQRPGTPEIPDASVSTTSTYVLYTSGSTGVPKGVVMGEDAAINLIAWQNRNSKAGKGTRTLQFAPLSFDVSFQEIVATLSTGGTLVLIDDILRLDMVALLDFIAAQKVNRLFLPFVALQALAEAAVSTRHFPDGLQEIMTAGEPLKITSQINGFFSGLNGCMLYNQYGPTECHVVSELRLQGNPDNWPTLPPIGKPIANTSIFILDKNQKILPDGKIGELYIGGSCLAEGYLNNRKLTDEKFIRWQSPESGVIRIYRTGDKARYLPDGTIAFLGREDDQVKINGHRIELGEVELTLSKLPGLKDAVVVASNHLPGQTQLAAYFRSDAKQDISDIREQVSGLLPEYMLPTHYIQVAEFPRTSSGKVDKKALPLPKYERPVTAPLYVKPGTDVQKNLGMVWSELLRIPKIGIDDNFFELGGTSLLAQRTVAMLLQKYGYKVPATKLYRFPTIAQLADYLDAGKKPMVFTSEIKDDRPDPLKDIAIIGMAGRFPGAESVQKLWDVLRDGKETTSFFTSEELDESLPEPLRNDAQYVKARGIIPSAKTFDAAFFGLNTKVAEAMDPQQRLFLEIAYEALEQAGHLPRHYSGSIGVYAGSGTNTYYKNNVLPNKNLLDAVGHLQADTLNEKDYIASRTAYHLNLRGPAVSVQSACSTSLLAVAEAVEALRNGQCDVALAGGSSITAPMHSGHLYQDGSMLSPDGHCRSFDAEGKGTVFSDGAGVVLLKSLEAAKKDGDTIYGIIKGIGLNNDGGNKGSFTAPSAEGQANAIGRALRDAKVSPSTISYVEAHGTATPLGDPIEIEGLRMAFGKQDKNGYCALGSIKSNMGHLTAAAGVAGLIKTVLALRHKKIPASLGFENPNPAIDFENSPFFVNNRLREWDNDSVRRAGVSSFGVGGTNVHVVLEEYPMEEKVSDPGRPLQLIAWSAKTETSLDDYGTILGDYLQTSAASASVKLADVAYTLNRTRDSFAHRRFVLAGSNNETFKELSAKDSQASHSKHLKAAPDETVFLFPGQGAQYVQMGRTLYEQEKVFRKAVDECSEILKAYLELDIRHILFPDTDIAKAEAQLRDTRFTQPALFVVEYAMAQLWMAWGIAPTSLCGHSIGEFVAAHLAGVFSLSDALRLIALRGRLVSGLPKGSMLSVRMDADRLEEILPENLSIAAVNSDRACVVSGTDKAIEAFVQKINTDDIPHRPLATSHAFHSTMMDPILESFGKAVEQTKLNAPRLPVISTVTGTWLTDAEATAPEYWTNHLRDTVRFSGAMDIILQQEDPILLEVGPGNTLSALARQKRSGRKVASLASLPRPKENEGDYPAVLTTLGQLWLNGHEPDWQAFYSGQSRQKVALPSYVFDRKPCWVEPLAPIPSATSLPFPTSDAFLRPETRTMSAPSATSDTVAGSEPYPRSNAFQNPFLLANNPGENYNSTPYMRKPSILEKISEIIENTSGIELETSDYQRPFLELGLDSLILTQMALMCKKEFDLPISFRQLNEQLASAELLAEHLDKQLPAERYAQATPASSPQQQGDGMAFASQNPNLPTPSGQNQQLDLIAGQLQLLGRQLESMRGENLVSNPGAKADDALTTFVSAKTGSTDDLSEEDKREHKKPFGASPKIERQSSELNMAQLTFLKDLIARYNKKTAASKAYAQKHRANMADPRVVSGFKPLTKELVYPIVVDRSSGSRLWDLDGNEYLDALNGFGSSLFGHQPDFIKKALQEQIELGYEVGPQHPLAGEVCDLLCEATGHDRAALCNTGSEAVLGAMRIARTVTGRSLIVEFSTSYHGINDEAIVRGSSKLKTFPAAAGIQPEAVQNILVLEYGTDKSLEIVRNRAHELAAVLVEPVQSRRPEFRPVDFLKEIRKITTASKTALIFDEVITGFRMHQGGTQALFGIKADIATYGKVIGGGLPIGAICGKREYMDALDGGFWQYGDDSSPDVGVTYFAGTFVRHPLALAASKASLMYLSEQGPALQQNLANMTEGFATFLNQEFETRNIAIRINYCGSLWRMQFLQDMPYSELLFVLLREKGIHIWDGFPCFVTTAFTKKDTEKLIDCILFSVEELVGAGLLRKGSAKDIPFKEHKKTSKELNTPPIDGARLGRDTKGNPAWFIADKHREGEFVKIEL